MLADHFLAEGLAPGTVAPLGNRRPQGAPWGVYRCEGEERWCVITCRDDSDWAGLRRALGDPEWARDERLGSAEGRQAAHDLIDVEVGRWTLERSDLEVMARLQAEGVPAGRMVYASDVPTEPQLAARGYPRTIHQPGLGDIMLEGPCFRGPAMAGPVIEPAPGLGQHTRQIAADLLGLDDARVDELIAAGVLEEDRPLDPTEVRSL
jgi:crotonobetainyl-CoA:carnitine CoA-transferase CaiB-like acyl-CoA transferase